MFRKRERKDLYLHISKKSINFAVEFNLTEKQLKSYTYEFIIC